MGGCFSLEQESSYEKGLRIFRMPERRPGESKDEWLVRYQHQQRLANYHSGLRADWKARERYDREHRHDYYYQQQRERDAQNYRQQQLDNNYYQMQMRQQYGS
jgi:hypothetical protein